MSFEYHRPTSLEEACRLCATLPGARFVAGGTDVMVRIREGKLRPSALVSLGRVAELSAIEPGSPFVIGAGVKVAELEANEAVLARLPVLAAAAGAVGSPQIRNAATLGGNLCNASPCADLAPPLLVHEARVRLASGQGTRELPLDEFFVGPRTSALAPGEVLCSIAVDVRPAARAVFLKKGRVQMDIALASAAVLIESDGDFCRRARIAVGSLGPRPMRLPATERELESHDLDDATIARARACAEEEVRPIGDVRAGADYRRHLAGVMVERGLRALISGGRR